MISEIVSKYICYKWQSKTHISMELHQSDVCEWIKSIWNEAVFWQHNSWELVDEREIRSNPLRIPLENDR